MKHNLRTTIAWILILAAASLKVSAQTIDDGIKMYNYHRWQSAQKILLPLAAGNARANYYLGLTYLEMDNPDNALTTFQKIPEDPANVSGTAIVAFAHKDYAKGTQILKDLTEKARKKDTDPFRFAGDAIVFGQGNDFNQAVSWDSIAVKRGVKDPALDNYEHARDMEKCNSLAFSRIGDLWFDAGNYKLALENYAKAKDCDATNPLPYKALADAYWRSGRYDKALENMQQFMKLSDNTFNDKKMNVEIMYQAKAYCDAVKNAKELLSATMPDSVRAELYGIIGFSQVYCNDSLNAVTNIRKYISMTPKRKITPAIYIDFGKLWMKLDNLDSTAYYYTLGLSIDTTHDKSDTYRELADAYKAKKNYCKSAEWYDNLVKALPEAQATDYAWRSIMFYFCGDYARTLSTSQEFIKRYPEQPSAYQYAAKSAAAIDSNDTSGLALPFYNQWLDKVGPNYAKKNEIKTAYGYMLVYYFNREEKDKDDADKLKDDKDKVILYKDKIREIDPNDRYLKQIEGLEKELQKQSKAKSKPVKK